MCADNFRRLLLQRMAEGVICSQEKPGIAATPDYFLRCSDRKRTGIEYPLDRVRRAELSVKISGAGRMHDQQLFPFLWRHSARPIQWRRPEHPRSNRPVRYRTIAAQPQLRHLV